MDEDFHLLEDEPEDMITLGEFAGNLRCKLIVKEKRNERPVSMYQ